VNTRTTSIRLEQDFIDEIDSKCSELDCTRNDFIKSAIESKLNKKPIAHANIIEINGVPVPEIKNPKIVEI